jgi:hypothetical protein
MVVQLSTFEFHVPTEADASAARGRMSWDEALIKSAGLRRLGEDWDGQGASAPRQELIEGCRILLETAQRHQVLPPPTFVAAAPDGAVCVEWQWKGIRLEAEVADDRIEWMYSPDDGSPGFFDTTWDLQPVD